MRVELKGFLRQILDLVDMQGQTIDGINFRCEGNARSRVHYALQFLKDMDLVKREKKNWSLTMVGMDVKSEGAEPVKDAPNEDFMEIVTPEYVSVCRNPIGSSPASPGVAEMDLKAPGTFGYDFAFWWIARVHVRPGYREDGLGTELLRRLLSYSGEHAVTVAPGGYGADPVRQKRFYKRAGFGESGKEGLLIRPKQRKKPA